jgi:hypothetical protein
MRSAPFESVASLAAAATPQLIRDSPWPPAAAFDLSPSTLAQVLPPLSRVRVLHSASNVNFWNPEPTLTYNPRWYDARADLDVDLDGARRGVDTMSAEDFFQPQDNAVHYFTTSMIDDAGRPHDLLSPLAPLAGIAADDTPPSLKVWMGTARAVTPLHLDAEHNFYALLHGAKTFWLFPPSDTHEALYLHPRLHPLAHFPPPRACMANECGRGDLFPGYEATGGPAAITVRLVAGDVIYIPPYWGHHAVCERDCVATNLWFPSAPVVASVQLDMLPLPFEMDWSKHLRHSAAALYLTLLLSAADADADAVARLLGTRWRHAELLAANAPPPPPPGLPPVGADCEPRAADAPPGVSLAELRRKFERYARARAAPLLSLESGAIRRVLLHDQVERIAHWAGGGTVAATHALLATVGACWAQSCSAEAAAGTDSRTSPRGRA